MDFAGKRQFILRFLRSWFLSLALALTSSPIAFADEVVTTDGSNQNVESVEDRGDDDPSFKEKIKNLTAQEREALKNLKISEQVQETANGLMSGTKPELTENDRKALHLLGYSEEEIDQLSLQSLKDEKERDKFKNRLNQYADGKSSEIEQGVMNDLVPGLASSVLGLAFATLLGLVVGIRCYNQPSALAFAGTSGAWVALEMMIWKGYQIRMDDIQTLQNATEYPRKIEEKIERAKEIIAKLESDFKKAGVEDYESFLAEHQSEVDELKEMAKALRGFLKKAKDEQFGALRSIQESIGLAAETSKKKSRNAKIAAIGFTAAAAAATAEAFSLFNNAGTCVGLTYQSPKRIGPLWQLLAQLIIRKTYAGFASVGDLDKIGIPIGGGMAAAYLGFEMKFADKIYSSATGRGLVFLAMAGIAYLAYSKLAKAAEFLDKQAKELDIFATAVEEKLDSFNVTFSESAQMIRELKDKLLPELQEIAESMGKKGGELKELLKEEGKGLAQEKLDELGLNEEEVKNLVIEELKFDQNKIVDDLKKQAKEKMEEVDTSGIPNFSGNLTGDLQSTPWINFINSVVPDVYAAKSFEAPASCFVRTRNYLSADESCQCRKGNKCFSSRYPAKMSLKNNNEFASFAYKVGSLVSQSSDAILSGKAKTGLGGFRKAGSFYQKMDLNARKLLSQKVGAKVDYRLTGRMIEGAFNQLRPGLKDYYKGNPTAQKKSRGTQRLNPTLSSRQMRKGRRRLVGAQGETMALRASLKEKLKLAKALGNPSLQDFKAASFKSSSSQGPAEEKYDYSKEAITRDPSKDIFQLIKKRYLIIQSQGRLSL